MPDRVENQGHAKTSNEEEQLRNGTTQGHSFWGRTLCLTYQYLLVTEGYTGCNELVKLKARSFWRRVLCGPLCGSVKLRRAITDTTVRERKKRFKSPEGGIPKPITGHFNLLPDSSCPRVPRTRNPLEVELSQPVDEGRPDVRIRGVKLVARPGRPA